MRKNFGKVVLILISILCFTSCGTKIKDNSSSVPGITIVIEDSEVDQPKSSTVALAKKVTKTTKETTTTTPEEEVPEEETTTTTTPTVTTTVELIKNEPEPIEEYLVYKPSTFYIHRSTCRWAAQGCYRIDNTDDIIARACTECNPDIEIKHKYIETTTTTTTIKEEEIEEETTTTTAAVPETEETAAAASRLSYELSDDDWFMICKVVCSETGYCGEKQQKAVANTIFNRIIYSATHEKSPYPKDVYGILHQKNQYNAINYWRSDTRLQPGGTYWNQTMIYVKEAAEEPDFTNGAIGYYNPQMSGYLSAFDNNSALELCYTDMSGRFFRLR